MTLYEWIEKIRDTEEIFTEQLVRSYFLIAGFQVSNVKKLSHGYWGGCPEHADIIKQRPWWFVRTEIGWIEIGWRKRVIHIGWEDTPVRGIVTEDNVTKENTMVHAYSALDAIKYLTELKRLSQLILSVV